MSVIRHRSVGHGFQEQLTILNHDDHPVPVTVRLEAGCDFADLFEVKDALDKQGTYSHSTEGSALRLTYQRDTFSRATTITSSRPCAVDEHGLTFQIDIAPHGQWTTDLDVAIELLAPSSEETSTVTWHGRRPGRNMADDLARWQADAPRLVCDWQPLQSTYQRTLVDLAALRFSPISAGRNALPAAGLPWFMTLFGRDSIFTSLQALPFAPQLAATTFRELALRQGTAWTTSATRTPAAFFMRCATAN